MWPLTQFYSVDFSKSRTVVKKCVFNKRKIQVCTNSSRLCPGPSPPSPTHLKVSLHLCSFESNVQGKTRALKGLCVTSKSPSSVRDGDKGVSARHGRKKCFPDEVGGCYIRDPSIGMDAILLRSFQPLPCLSLGLLKGFLNKHGALHGPSISTHRWGGPSTKSWSTDINVEFDCVKTLLEKGKNTKLCVYSNNN